MALEPRIYYEETGNTETEGVVAINDTQTVEKRGGQWYGPIDADMDGMDDAVESGLLERVGELTDEQFTQIIGIAEA